MSKVKWTEEQEQAIYEKNTNILVAAAAGSGKTAVLVERIINKIINEGIDIDRLLVVTFTNAAASEMRERVLDAIYKRLDKEPENEKLQRQIREKRITERDLSVQDREDLREMYKLQIEQLKRNIKEKQSAIVKEKYEIKRKSHSTGSVT